MSGWWEPVAWVIAFAALVAVSGFFSGTAAALIAFNRFRLRYGTPDKGGRRMQRAVALFDDAQRVLAVSLIGSTLASVAALIALMLSLTALWVPRGNPLDWGTVTVALLAGILIMLVFGEVVPRRLFRERANRMIPYLYHPIRWSLALLGPCAGTGIWLARWVTRWRGIPDLPPGALAHSEPWQSLLEAGEESFSSAADQEATESRMIHGIFDLQKTRVREVMRPLVDLVAVRLPERTGAVRRLARETGYSRLPVYRDRITNLVGYLDIYDILTSDLSDEKPVDDCVREAFYVPETKRLDDLLQELLHGHHKVAIVVDEYGGCSGWVTREDLLEEIVGEIEDEFDRAAEPIRRLDEQTYLVSAAIDIDDLNEQLGVRLPSAEFDTLGGFVYSVFGRIPQVGDSFEDNGVRYEVTEMDNRRIVAVRITLPARDAPPLSPG